MKKIFPEILRNKYFIYVFVFIITFVSRILFLEKYFFDGDSVSFAFGSLSYSLQNTRPHLPGYYLHVQIISLVNYFIQNLNLTMILISTVYSSLSAVIIFRLLKKWFENETVILIAGLIIFNPMVWYYGSTSEIYSFDLFFGAFLISLLLNPKTLLYSPFVFVLGFGIRQSSAVLIFPVYVFLWLQNYKQKKINLLQLVLSHAVSLIVMLAWLIPMIHSAGGLQEYLSLYKKNSPFPKINLAQNILQFTSYSLFVFTPLIMIIAVSKKINTIYRVIKTFDRKLLFVFLLWIIPSMLLFIFVHYSKGYFLLIIIPLYSFVGILINKKIIKPQLITFVIVLEILFFVLVPYKMPSHESLIKQNLRSSNPITTWLDRTLSSYLMSASRIKYQDNVIEELSLLVKENNESIIFLDPNIYLFARGLQILFPEKTFVTMDFYQQNGFIEYNGLNIEKKHGFDKRLINSILILPNEIFAQRKNLFISEINHSKNFSLIKVDEKLSKNLFHYYQDFYLR